MGLIVGILIGVFCRRYRTALAWCVGLSALLAAFLTLGAAQDARSSFTGKAVVVLIGFATSLLFLFAGAAGAIAVKRLIARNEAQVPKAEVFGPSPGAQEAPAQRPVSGA